MTTNFRAANEKVLFLEFDHMAMEPHFELQPVRSTAFPFLSKSFDFNNSLKLPSAYDVLLFRPWNMSLDDPLFLVHGSQEPRLPSIDDRPSGSGLIVEAMDSFRISFGAVKELKAGEVY